MDPLPAPPAAEARARRVRLAAAAVLVGLYAVEARGLLAALASRSAPPTLGQFAKGSDVIGYYAWLRSPLVDGDFHFDDEFAPTFAAVPGSDAALPPTRTGHRPNPWSVGPAVAWAPAVGAVHLALTALGERSPWPADGYAPPYLLAAGLTTLALAVLGLELAYRIGRRFAPPGAAAAGAAVAVLATPVVGYGAAEVGAAHGPAAAALAAYAFVWLRTLGSHRAGRWAAVGALLGLACLMRWQLATFAVLPALEAAWLAARAGGWSARAAVAARLILAAVASVAAFAPQVAGWLVVYGTPFGGLHDTAKNWLAPSLWTVLGSTDHGLFYWTPATLPALAGLAVLAARGGRPAAAFLLAAVTVQVYVVAAVQGRAVYLGWAFGFRHLTETCLLLAPGAAALVARADRPRATGLAVGGLAGWNLLLLGVYRHCVGGLGGAAPAELVELVARYAALRPWEAVGCVAAAVWLGRTVASALPPDDPAAPARADAPPLRRAA